MTIRLDEKREHRFGGWTRYATLDDGRRFQVCVTRGKTVRIAFARRGENIGHHWWAQVREVETGVTLPKTLKRYETFRVNKSNGVRGILRALEIIN